MKVTVTALVVALMALNQAQSSSFFIFDVFFPSKGADLVSCYNCTGRCAHENITVQNCTQASPKCLTQVEGANITRKCVPSSFSCDLKNKNLTLCEICGHNLCNDQAIVLVNPQRNHQESAHKRNDSHPSPHPAATKNIPKAAALKKENSPPINKTEEVKISAGIKSHVSPLLVILSIALITFYSAQ